ncbi:hypothetical protein [Microcoleus sp. herbarium12]|uniref:hypothetical protein n=1 Tax=Microcoleus sp. herbarium12 TaxID=3055437 RepID=UPI002FCEA99E
MASFHLPSRFGSIDIQLIGQLGTVILARFAIANGDRADLISEALFQSPTHQYSEN